MFSAIKNLTKQFIFTTSTLLILLSNSLLYAKADFNPSMDLGEAISSAEKLRFQNPDSSILNLQIHYKEAVEISDTAMAIKALMGLARVYGHQAKYKESYDRLWTALLLADEAQMEMEISSIYRAIGRYYSFYSRKENAIKYLGYSLEIKKRLVEKGELEPENLAGNYLAFCATYRELNEVELGQKYLDSCFLHHSPGLSRTNLSFLKFEQAVLYNEDKKFKEAIKIFNEILPWYQKNNPSYLVLVYNYLADSYKELGDFKKSENNYKLALQISDAYHSHVDFTPLIHERLSALYYSHGVFAKSYESLRKAKDLDAAFFDSRSEYNRPLLEIQDAFRREKEEQAILLQEQELARLEQEEKVLLLQKVILSGFIIFLVLFGFLYFKYIKSKHQVEKQLIQKKQELESQKNQEVLELKNKELAASALKLIEKEALIDALKDKLSKGDGDIKRQDIKRLVRSISNNNTENWKEFEARFVSVNKSFYEKLNRQFPKLTQGDLKLCALVKLNFSSKEMAKLLGNSVESIHTTRHRLRKKLNLPRETNLKEFIASV